MSLLVSFLFRIIQILISTQFSLKQWISKDPKQCFPIPLGHNKDRRLGSISRRDDTGFHQIILAFTRNLWISGRRRLTGRKLKVFFAYFQKNKTPKSFILLFSPEKLTQLFLMGNVKPSPERRMSKLLTFYSYHILV